MGNNNVDDYEGNENDRQKSETISEQLLYPQFSLNI